MIGESNGENFQKGAWLPSATAAANNNIEKYL